MAEALVVIPTHDHALLLPLAIRSAQEQTVADLAIVVIGDGVGDDTRDALAPLLAGDPRITFLDRPKAGRTGEPHRDPVVRATDAPCTTYLSDDDLFLPDHVDLLRHVLEDADVACPHPGLVDAHGAVVVHPVDLADPGWVAVQLAGDSLMGLTGVAHRTTAYRRLPYGWRTTPTGSYTDQYMWQQFLAQPWCRVAMAPRPTTVRLPAPARTAMSPEQRHAEMARWVERLATPKGRTAYVEDVMAATRRAGASARLTAIQAGATVAALTAQVAELHDERAALRQQLDAALAETQAVRAQLAEARTTGATLDAAWRTSQVDHRAAVAAHDAAVVALEAAAAERDALQVRLDAMATEREALQARADAAAAEHAVVADQLARLANTRTVRMRDRLVRVRLVRTLLARRPPAG